MNGRAIVGVLAGLVLWWFLFFAIGIGFGLVVPEYGEAARMMFQEQDTSGFTTPLLFMNWVLFVIAGLVVGWATSLIGRSRQSTPVLSAAFLIFMVVNHYVLEWDSFPVWYNLIVPLIIAGTILVGGRILPAPEARA